MDLTWHTILIGWDGDIMIEFLGENKLKILIAIIYLAVLFSMIVGSYVKSREEDKRVSAMLIQGQPWNNMCRLFRRFARTIKF